MSTFIDKADYGTAINEYILDQVTRFDDTKLDAAEDAAVSEIKSYLSSRYDVDAIFAQTGTGRHPLIKMYVVDISLFHLHSIINPKKVPDIRKERYELAIAWLEKVQALKANPDLPPVLLPETGTKDYIQFGGNLKRSNHLQ